MKREYKGFTIIKFSRRDCWHVLPFGKRTYLNEDGEANEPVFKSKYLRKCKEYIDIGQYLPLK